jgi:lipopolysaccharide transport system ATP-binding protein
MSETVIRVHQLSKEYHLKKFARSTTFREKITDLARSPLKNIGLRFKKPSSEDFIWALKDITFDITNGEFVGIVGRNGAGKTTLLKILTRITEPTHGFAEIHGNNSALLEVGTGFHQELTGRENIYLNGSILGMKRSEINQRFDQIVAFSGVEKFIDTQVKHYSTGMRVRLAFSVAAHLKPQILFIDEVLAVGDHEFQQKCLAKMKEITADGRTVILVSHNLAAIKEMCNKCIVLDNGELRYIGPTAEGLTMYCMSLADDEMEEIQGGGWWNVLVDGENAEVGVSLDRAVLMEAQLDLTEDFHNALMHFTIKDSSGNMVVLERVTTQQVMGHDLAKGRYRVAVEIPPLWLAPGAYMIRFRFSGTTKAGDPKLFVSPRTILNVSGSFRGKDHARALLHPRVQWNMNSTDSQSSVRIPAKVQGL